MSNSQPMKIRELPFGVVFDLCRYLDQTDLPNHSWKALLTKAPGVQYSALDVAAFERVGLRPNSSSCEAVIQDFSIRGFTVDDLFLMLNGIQHIEGMRLLRDYVSESLHLAFCPHPKTPSFPSRYSPEADAPSSAPTPTHYQMHPKLGPLPPPRKGQGSSLTSSPEESGMSSVSIPFPSATPSSVSSCGPPLYPVSVSSMYSHPNSIPLVAQALHSSGVNPYSSSEIHHSLGSTPEFGLPNYPGSANQIPRPVVLPYPHPPPPITSSMSSQVHSDGSPPAYMSSPGSSNSARVPIPYQQQQQPQQQVPFPSSVIDLPSILCFTYKELSDATGNFTENLVGYGYFGSVFKATIRGSGPYAIKKLHNASEMEGGIFFDTINQDQLSFTQELKLLTKYHHKNILSLVAYSNNGPRPCLVYEYMENGSLADCLKKKNVVLPWHTRLNITFQISEALHFLHTINQPQGICLVHGDVKSANILLDAHMVPKLSDFGLARECKSKPNQHSTTVSTKSAVVMGTVAYMAPEFMRNRHMTPKTDVYSFGVVLVELFTGMAADDPTLEDRMLTSRLERLFENTEQNRTEILVHVDPVARWPDNIGFGLFDVGTVCLRKKAKNRPPMDQVQAQLKQLTVEGELLIQQNQLQNLSLVSHHHPV